MTDKEKMKKLLDSYVDDRDSFERIICSYLYFYVNDFSATRLHDLIDTINDDFFKPYIDKLERANNVASERARYLKTYLEGNMYVDQGPVTEYDQIQLRNAEAIIDACCLWKGD